VNANPRIAKTENLERTRGDDGKLYILTNKEDYAKYRLASDDDDANYMQKYASLNKASKQRPKSAHAKIETPYKTARLTQNASRQLSQDYADKTQPIHIDDNFETSIQFSSKSRRNATMTGHESLQPKGAPSDIVTSTVDILQEKYEENLGVIDALFHEKQAMERRMRAMEQQLQQSLHMQQWVEKRRARSAHDETEYSHDNYQFQSNRNPTKELSASQAADFFGQDTDLSPRIKAGLSSSLCLDDRRPSSVGRQPRSEVGRNSFNALATRSLSAGRFIVYAELQADQDRYKKTFCN